MATVSSEIFVHAPVKMAYRAFTNSTSLREWLCDVATVEPHTRGRMYLWWHGDFYSSGHYLELDENKKVKFRWYSSIDPAPTEVTVTVTEKDGGALIRQTAVFDPVGLAGLMYWYSIYPLHQLVFTGMLRGIANAAEHPTREP